MLSFKDIANQIEAQHHGKDSPVTSVSIDSRTITKGEWFAAITGPNFDGHNFITQAVNKGAAGLILNQYQPKFKHIPQIIYPDTTKALGLIAKRWRQEFKIPVIGITGSCGKTTTKLMLESILKNKFNTLTSPKNYNNEYGLPLTLMQLTDKHEVAIIEIGINSPGEMQYLVDICQPTIALITNIQPAHIGNFDSIEQLAEQKLALFNSKQLKIAVINLDDPILSNQIEQLKAKDAQIISFSKDQDLIAKQNNNTKPDLSASKVSSVQSVSGIVMQFTLHTPISDDIMAVPLIGEQAVENSVGASACALSVGAQPEDIKTGLIQVAPAKGRMYPYYLPDGKILIDDTYNSSFNSVIQAINTLSELPGKRVLICSTLSEVGAFAQDLHQKIAQCINNKIHNGADFEKIIFTGEQEYINLMQETVTKTGTQVEFIDNHMEITSALEKYLQDPLVKSIIVKGARTYQLDLVIDQALKSLQLQFCTQ